MKRSWRLALVLACGMSATGCVTRDGATTLCDAGPADPAVSSLPCRPFRAGMIKMSPSLDQIKPLAAADPSGWVLTSDVLVGSFDEDWVGGISLKDNRVLWMLPTQSGLVAPVAAFGSWVILGFRDGRIAKVESLTGKVVWEAKLARFVSRPFALSGSHLLAMTAGQQLYSLDFQTGKTLWVYDTGSSEGLVVASGAAPLVRDNRVYVGTVRGELHVVGLEDGKQLWTHNPAYTDFRFHDTVGDLVLANNRLVMTRYDGIVAAIATESSEKRSLWKEELPSITTSTYRSGILYVGCLNGDVYAIDTSSGRGLWRATIGESVGSITAGEKVLYAAGSGGRIAALNATEGDMLWIDDVEGSIRHKAVVFNDRIYFPTGLKVLYGYKLL